MAEPAKKKIKKSSEPSSRGAPAASGGRKTRENGSSSAGTQTGKKPAKSDNQLSLNAFFTSPSKSSKPLDRKDKIQKRKEQLDSRKGKGIEEAEVIDLDASDSDGSDLSSLDDQVQSKKGNPTDSDLAANPRPRSNFSSNSQSDSDFEILEGTPNATASGAAPTFSTTEGNKSSSEAREKTGREWWKTGSGIPKNKTTSSSQLTPQSGKKSTKLVSNGLLGAIGQNVVKSGGIEGDEQVEALGSSPQTPKKEARPVPTDAKTPVKMMVLQPSSSSTPLIKEERLKEEGDVKSSTSEPVGNSADQPSDEPFHWDVDSLTFDPKTYDTSSWPTGRLPYGVLVEVYVQVGATRSRLAILRIITNFLRVLIYHSPKDLLPTIYLLSNHLAPSYIPLELGVGFQILNKAVVEVSGTNRETMKRLWDKYGDPGDVAFEAKSNLRTLVKPSRLIAHVVYSQLIKIAKIKGSGAGKAKGDIVRRLLVQAKGEEVRYLVTLLSSLARAFVLTPPVSIEVSSTLHATSEELAGVIPTPEKGSKGKGKAKEESDLSRVPLESKIQLGIATLRKVYVRHPNYEDILNALFEGGFDALESRVPVSVGIPLSPMLGSITRSLNEVFTRLGDLPFTSEAKLDGQRVQIHARIDGPAGEGDGGGRWVESRSGRTRVWVRLFSRHLEDMTEKYPDICGTIAELLERAVPSQPTPFPDKPNLSTPSTKMLELLSCKQITSLVIDAEVVAIDKDNPEILRTFQELTNRAKKDVKLEEIRVIVGVFSFDLMLLNDQPLLSQPFSVRRHLLRTLLPAFFDPDNLLIARFGHVESIDSTSAEDVQQFFEKVVSQKCEGLMVKLLESGEGLVGEDAEDEEEIVEMKKVNAGAGTGNRKPLPSTYEPDMRSQGWLKVKKDYLEGVGDSLDLVPIGAWWGMGRKAGWYSPFLLALYNPDTGAFEAVCKCISGFTDAFYKEMLVKYPADNAPDKCNKVSPLAYYETGGLRPDFWFAPSEVWEIRGADISLSPVYPAAASHLGGERGLSVRFPRFIRIRDDKSWEEATTSMQFADMYRRQIAEAPAKARPEDLDAAAEIADDIGTSV